MLYPNSLAIAKWTESNDPKSIKSGKTWLNRSTVILPDDITDRQLQRLINHKLLNTLQNLKIKSSNNLTNKGLAHVSALKNLQQLELNQCTEITDAGFAHLSRLENLQRLSLYYCNQLTIEGLAKLSGLQNLTQLDLNLYTQFTDEKLELLSDFK